MGNGAFWKLCRVFRDRILATSRLVPSFEGVPVIRFLITTVVLIAGLIGAAFLVVFGLVIFIFNRLFGGAAPMPRFQATFRTSRPAQTRARPPQGDVIDVVATEVKDGSAHTQPRLDR
jgi:hypothetical protein